MTTPTSATKTVRDAVGGQAALLQRQLREGSSAARGTVAGLRNSLGSQPGADPCAWEETIGILPEHLQGRGNKPSNAEWASHVSMTLFALHLQGGRASHAWGPSLGAAARDLSVQRREGTIDRRFHQIVANLNSKAVAYHLRTFIPLLRGKSINLDFGRLAADLFLAQSGNYVNQVRLGWARDYAKKNNTTKADAPEGVAEERNA